MSILIITHSQDNESIPLVMTAIKASGEKVFRFDTDKFPTQTLLDILIVMAARILLLLTSNRS